MSVDYAALQNQQLPTSSWLSSPLSLIKYSPLRKLQPPGPAAVMVFILAVPFAWNTLHLTVHWHIPSDSGKYHVNIFMLSTSLSARTVSLQPLKWDII